MRCSIVSLGIFLLVSLITLAVIIPSVFAEGETIVVEKSEPEIRPASVAQLDRGEYELFYDDGTRELAADWYNHYWAVRFNISEPLFYPVRIERIRVFFTRVARSVDLVVFDEDGTTVLWKRTIPPQEAGVSINKWVEVDCLLNVYRDFYIAVNYTTPISDGKTSFLGLDQSSVSDHSYYGPPMTPLPLPSPDDDVYGNWMIRAIVSKREPPVGGQLLDNTTFSITSVSSTILMVPIVALSAYLLLTKWKAKKQ